MHPAASLVRRSVLACVSALALVLGLPGVAIAQVEQTFFARQYDHALAGPTRAADTFAVPDNFTGPFKLRIQNATADESVNAGWVYLNGVQIAAPAFQESVLLDAAHALEAEIGFDGRPR